MDVPPPFSSPPPPPPSAARRVPEKRPSSFSTNNNTNNSNSTVHPPGKAHRRPLPPPSCSIYLEDGAIDNNNDNSNPPDGGVSGDEQGHDHDLEPERPPTDLETVAGLLSEALRRLRALSTAGPPPPPPAAAAAQRRLLMDRLSPFSPVRRTPSSRLQQPQPQQQPHQRSMPSLVSSSFSLGAPTSGWGLGGLSTRTLAPSPVATRRTPRSDSSTTALDNSNEDGDGYGCCSGALRTLEQVAALQQQQRLEQQDDHDPTTADGSADVHRGGKWYPNWKRFVDGVLPYFLEQQRDIERNTRGTDRVLHPTSLLYFVLDVVLFVAILLIVATTPIMIGWDSDGVLVRRIGTINMWVDAIFILDIVKHFYTGVVMVDGSFLADRKEIRDRYFRGFFVVDFVSGIPYDFFFMRAGAFPGRAYNLVRHPLKMLKVLRMPELVHHSRVRTLVEWISSTVARAETFLSFRFSEGLVKLARLFLFTALLAHWIGCFNFFLVRVHEFPEDSWVVFADLQDRGVFEQWKWSFFKAAAQMILIGFESPPFVNTSCSTTSEWCKKEHWVTLCCLFIGALFFSLLIASIHSIIQTSNLASHRYDDRHRNLEGFLRREGLSPDERQRILQDFVQRHPKNRLYNESDILQDVEPHRLRAIQMNRVRELTDRCQLFMAGRNLGLLEALSQVMVRTTYYPGETISSLHAHGDSVFFVSSGMVELLCPSESYSYGGDRDRPAFWILTGGAVFGFEPVHCSSSGGRPFMATRALTKCVLFQLSASDWARIQADFPHLQEYWEEIADSHQKRAQRSDWTEEGEEEEEIHVECNLPREGGHAGALELT